MKTNQNIPAGSEVPVVETPGQTAEPAGTPPAAQAGDNTPVADSGADRAGDMKSLQEQLANAQKLLGRQGKELGELRQSYTALSEKAQKAADTSSNPDFDTRLADIQAQVDSGDIDFGQALRLTAQLSAEMGASQAATNIQGQLRQDENRKIQQAFLDANPEFTELVETGALDEIKAANPLHDDVSAYYEYQAVKTRADMAAAIEKARQEGEQKGVKEADQVRNAQKVLGKQGDAVRNTQAKSVTFNSPAEKRQAMIDALKEARSSA